LQGCIIEHKKGKDTRTAIYAKTALVLLDQLGKITLTGRRTIKYKGRGAVSFLQLRATLSL
jgi:hypothetical protein